MAMNQRRQEQIRSDLHKTKGYQWKLSIPEEQQAEAIAGYPSEIQWKHENATNAQTKPTEDNRRRIKPRRWTNLS